MLVPAIVALAMQALVYPQGGAVGLAPPPGMAEAAGFAGFEHADTQASIVIAELPAKAYAELVAKIDADPKALPNGVVLDGEGEAITLGDGSKARLYRGRQRPAGQAEQAKWLLLVGGERVTALVTAQLPVEYAAAATRAIEAALRSTRLRAPAEIEAAIVALPFTVGDRAGFRAVRTIAGSGLLLTEGPLDIDTDGAQPIAIVAASLGPVAQTGDRADIARRMFEGTSELTKITVTERRGSADGLDQMVTGTAVDRARYVRLRQHVRFAADGSYLRVMCVWPVADDLSERCDRLAASVARR